MADGSYSIERMRLCVMCVSSSKEKASTKNCCRSFHAEANLIGSCGHFCRTLCRTPFSLPIQRKSYSASLWHSRKMAMAAIVWNPSPPFEARHPSCTWCIHPGLGYTLHVRDARVLSFILINKGNTHPV
jgi:hypothetical protein